MRANETICEAGVPCLVQRWHYDLEWCGFIVELVNGRSVWLGTASLPLALSSALYEYFEFYDSHSLYESEAIRSLLERYVEPRWALMSVV